MPALKAAGQPLQAVPRSLDFEQIKGIIPQRFPFLMLDRVTELVPHERLIGIKNLTGNEWFYQGHFPARAITPGAMMLEAIAQAGIVFFHFCYPPQQKLTYLLGSAKIRFLKPVFPGSQLQIEVTPIRLTAGAGILNGVISVEGRVVAKGEFALGTKVHDSW
jgi:3-hydroxyacyl-[acyl-carrier-protein] dehydratase